jgi:hypothetical protein
MKKKKMNKKFTYINPVKLYDLRGNRVSTQLNFHHGNWKTLGVKYMKNRNVIIGLSVFGLAAQAFVLISGTGLEPAKASMFNAASMIALFVAFIASTLSQKTECAFRREREDLNREFDAVYRNIGDEIQGLRIDINRESTRSKK